MFRILSVVVLLLFSWIGCSASVQAGGGPENVVVLVNADSRSSLLIANLYVELRGIPGRNVIYLNGIPDQERVSYEVFKDKILLPAIKEIKRRQISSQIDYIVYSADFPTQVGIGEVVKNYLSRAREEVGEQRAAGLKKLTRSVASINAVTYFTTRVLMDEPSFVSLDANKYMRGRSVDILRTPFVGEFGESYRNALKLNMSKEFQASLDLLGPLAQAHPKQVAVHYLRARNLAGLGKKEAALESLRQAVNAGWAYRSFTRTDLTLASLRDEKGFQELLLQIPDNEYRLLPTMGFRSSYCWGQNGMVNSSLKQGESYLLSTVLAVTRNQGVSEATAVMQLTRSIQADGTQPTGYFGFADTKDVRNKTRKPHYLFAVQQLREMGQEAEIFQSKLPRNKPNIMGLMIGTAKFSLENSNNRIQPGAICENLTSFGGALQRGSGQTKLSHFLQQGAAGSSGTVIEPYAILNKFPHPNMHVHYVRGCSLAEAFYQAVSGPFQLLIVGDALCQPWARISNFKMAGVNPFDKVRGVMKLRPEFTELKERIREIEIYIDGVKVKTSKGFGKISINTANIPDGFHELRFVAVGESPIETRSRYVLAFEVVNRGLFCDLKCQDSKRNETDIFKVKVESAGATKIEIKQHERVLATVEGESGSAEFSAATIGRGKTRLVAVAYHDGKPVRSVPVLVEVTGKLSTSPRVLATKKK